MGKLSNRTQSESFPKRDHVEEEPDCDMAPDGTSLAKLLVREK